MATGGIVQSKNQMCRVFINEGDHLDMMADIHFCSSVLRQSVCNHQVIGSSDLPVEVKQHPQYGDQLLLVVLVPLLHKL